MSAADRLEELVGPGIARAILDALREELVATDSHAPSLLSPWLTVDQTAEYLGTTAKAVRRRIDRGRLRAVRDGRRIYVDREALDAAFAAGRGTLSGTTHKAPATRKRPGARPKECDLP